MSKGLTFPTFLFLNLFLIDKFSKNFISERSRKKRHVSSWYLILFVQTVGGRFQHSNEIQQWPPCNILSPWDIPSQLATFWRGSHFQEIPQTGPTSLHDIWPHGLRISLGQPFPTTQPYIISSWSVMGKVYSDKAKVHISKGLFETLC